MQTLVWDENISLKNIDKFKRCIDQILLSKKTGLILDLEKVAYMNELALGIIANAVKEAMKMKKEIVIINNQKTLKTIFEIVSFYSLVKVFSNRQQALHYFQKNIFRPSKKKVANG
ncbi:STAS domain-containing protein [Bacillus sp. P2(2020)]|uniref:STAS domain-containing protein n=1 Tax=Calidifontibacillus erzurumensis TaxID=2741433 RepID=A0A8J8KB88_9BACI|nr:STAS domain-containing protein [Calidifontibacillus erzurumensis]